MKYKVWEFKNGKFGGVLYDFNNKLELSENKAKALKKYHEENSNKYDNLEFIIQSVDIEAPFSGMGYEKFPYAKY